MKDPRLCKFCGHAILSTSHANARFCSRDCFHAAQRKSHERAQALRYGPVKPLASRDQLEVGQRVNVPFVQRMTIGGAVKDVKVTEIGTVRKIDGDAVTVDVRGKSRQCTREQLSACAKRDLAVRFGHGMAVGGDAS